MRCSRRLESASALNEFPYRCHGFHDDGGIVRRHAILSVPHHRKLSELVLVMTLRGVLTTCPQQFVIASSFMDGLVSLGRLVRLARQAAQDRKVVEIIKAALDDLILPVSATARWRDDEAPAQNVDWPTWVRLDPAALSIELAVAHEISRTQCER